jgi:hypothetical protein
MLRSGEAQRPLPGFYEVNERCIEMLVNAARHDLGRNFALVAELREPLLRLDPRMRQRAAAQAFLLVDLEFSNVDWWRAARTQGTQPLRIPLWRGAFPRASAVQLAVATLMLAWNSVRTDPSGAQVLLGMTLPVAEIIAAFRFEDIDRIARKRFAYARPRWEDRPAVWRRLLAAAQANDPKAMGAFKLHAVQLLAGDLLSIRAPEETPRRPSASP